MICLAVIAQAPTTASLPDPNHFASVGWVVVILTALIVALRSGMGFVRDLKDKPAPGDVARESAERFATKAELRDRAAEWDKESRRLYDKREEDLRLAAQSRKAMHEDVQKISEGLSALTATTQLQNQTLAGVTSDIKRILERLPR